MEDNELPPSLSILPKGLQQWLVLAAGVIALLGMLGLHIVNTQSSEDMRSQRDFNNEIVRQNTELRTLIDSEDKKITQNQSELNDLKAKQEIDNYRLDALEKSKK